MNGFSSFSFDLGAPLLGWPLVNVLLAVLTVSLAGLLAARLAGGRPAALRSGLLLAALLLAAAAPLASAASWYGRLGLWPAPGSEAVSPPVAALAAEPIPLDLLLAQPPPPSVYLIPDPAIPTEGAHAFREASSATAFVSTKEPAVEGSAFDLLNLRLVFDMLFLTWLTGAGIGFARLAWSGLRLRRFASRCRPATSPRALAALASAAKKVGLASPPRLATAPATSAPAAFGLLRPVVAMPEGLVDELDDDELEAVFLHEAGHTAGGDAWVSLLQAVLGAAYWPLVPLHWLSAQLSAAREELCDDYVVAAQGDGRRFAEVLVRLAERAAEPPPSPALALLDPGPSGLELRLRQLLRKDRRPMTNLTPAARLGLASFAAALLASATFAQLRADAPPVPPSAPEAPRAVDPFGVPSADPNLDPTTAPPSVPKRGRMAPIPPQPPVLPGAVPAPPLPPTGKPSPFGSQPVAPGFVPDATDPTQAAILRLSPAAREEAEAAERIGRIVADPDFWSKEGAKTSHDFTPAEIAAVKAKGVRDADPRTPGRLRHLKLAADLDGKARLAEGIPVDSARQAASGAFAWLEKNEKDSPEARKFDYRQGMRYYSVSVRDGDAFPDHLWILLEDAYPLVAPCGLNLRWNFKTGAVDKSEHWGAVREVPAALIAEFAKQSEEAAARRPMEVPDGFEAVPGGFTVEKKAVRYLETNGNAEVVAEEWTRLTVRHLQTGDLRRLASRTTTQESWDVGGEGKPVVRSTTLLEGKRFQNDVEVREVPPAERPPRRGLGVKKDRSNDPFANQPPPASISTWYGDRSGGATGLRQGKGPRDVVASIGSPPNDVVLETPEGCDQVLSATVDRRVAACRRHAGGLTVRVEIWSTVAGRTAGGEVRVARSVTTTEDLWRLDGDLPTFVESRPVLTQQFALAVPPSGPSAAPSALPLPQSSTPPSVPAAPAVPPPSAAPAAPAAPAVEPAPRAPQDPNRPPPPVPPVGVPAANPFLQAPAAAPEVRAEVDPEKKMAALVAAADFWSKEGAKNTHDFTPAEIAWLRERGDPSGDLRAPGRLRLQKLRCDVDGAGRLFPAVPAEVCREAVGGSFAWLESQSAGSPEGRRFDHRQGFTHYLVTPRENEVAVDHVWFLIEDAAPGRGASGLNLRWNTVQKTVDKAEHWGANREVPAAVVEALRAQAADHEKRPKLEIPDGYEAVPDTLQTTKRVDRYREEQGAADAYVEESTTLKVKHSKTGQERRLTLRTVAKELWDVASSPPRPLRSTLVYSTGPQLEDASGKAGDPNRATPK